MSRDGDVAGEQPALRARDLRVSFSAGARRGGDVHVLNDVSLDIRAGETVGLVGESGSGKTTLGRAVLGLVRVRAGHIELFGERVENAGRRRRRELSKRVQVVFQDPYSSLNPSMTIGQTLAEPLQAQGFSFRDARRNIESLLEKVALPADAAHRLPREFSGGQRQRVAIARALAIEPELVVCDEPVSALDLTTQRTVLDLLRDIQDRTGLAYLFISHDVSVVRYMSHRVNVLQHGTIVESGDTDRVTVTPEHPYTERLLRAVPVADPERQRARRAARVAVSPDSAGAGPSEGSR